MCDVTQFFVVGKCVMKFYIGPFSPVSLYAFMIISYLKGTVFIFGIRIYKIKLSSFLYKISQHPTCVSLVLLLRNSEDGFLMMCYNPSALKNSDIVYHNCVYNSEILNIYCTKVYVIGLRLTC